MNADDSTTPRQRDLFETPASPPVPAPHASDFNVVATEGGGWGVMLIGRLVGASGNTCTIPSVN